MRSQSKHLSLIYEKPFSNKDTEQQQNLVNGIVDVTTLFHNTLVHITANHVIYFIDYL